MLPKTISSSFTLAAYIRGFKVIKLKGRITNFSSSLNSTLLKGIFCSKLVLALERIFTSNTASLSLVVSAFLVILFKRFSIISKSASISSTLIISMSRIGSHFPSTCVIFSSSKQRTTSTIASTSRI